MRPVGIDVGYGHTKVVAGSKPIVFQSLVGPAKDIAFSLGGEDSAGDVVEWKGEKFFVGGKAIHSDMIYFLRDRNWIGSNIYAALVISALNRIPDITSGEEVVIVSGLPVDYMKDAVVTQGTVRSVCESMGINVVDIKIVPQPIGTFFDSFLDIEGDPLDTPVIKKIGVVDTGYSTTDFVLIEDCRENIERAAGSVSKGAHDVYSLVARELKNDFNKNNVSIKDAEKAVSTRQFKSNGKVNDVSSLINKVLCQLGTSIQNIIRSKWVDEGEIDKVLLTGGGSVLLREYLTEIAPVTELVKVPQIANARGYYKRASAYIKSLHEQQGQG